jgi:hypothetical protein
MAAYIMAHSANDRCRKRISLAINGTCGKRLSTQAIEWIRQDRLGTGKPTSCGIASRAPEDAGAKVPEIQAQLPREPDDDPALTDRTARRRTSAR